MQTKHNTMIHETIQIERKKAGLTQAQLGKRVNMHRDRISGIEAGTGKLSLIELHSILEVFNLKCLIFNHNELEKAMQTKLSEDKRFKPKI